VSRVSATERFDVIIVGSGAGGGTMAHALAPTGARILLVERGEAVPREAENWDPAAVWRDLRYRTRETWVDREGAEFLPYTHYCVGGNTKFWGSVLIRLRREDFGVLRHVDGESPAWPIDYETLAPYYDRAEVLYGVRGQAGTDPTEPSRGPFPHAPVPHAPMMQAIVDDLRAQGLRPFHLPLGLLGPGTEGGCVLCNTCNSFPCRLGAKSDAEVCAVTPAAAFPNVTLWTSALARRLCTNAAGTRVEAVEVERLADAFADGQPRVQRAERILEDHLEMPPLRPQRGPAQPGEVFAFETDGSPGRLHEPDHRPAERGLAAATFAHQTHGLARRHGQAHVVHRPDVSAHAGEHALLHREMDPEVLDFEQRHRRTLGRRLRRRNRKPVAERAPDSARRASPKSWLAKTRRSPLPWAHVQPVHCDG
jgi:hypothetical protein